MPRKRTIKNKPCLKCKRIFRPRDKYKKFCSKECYWSSDNNRKGLSCGPKSLFRPIEERFWSFVFKTNNCWFWLGATNYGYGVLYDGEKNAIHAHRVSWEIHFGPIPKDKLVCHSCDIRQCINPEHLFLGTDADNLQDAIMKGRLHPPQTYMTSRWRKSSEQSSEAPKGK